MSYDLESSIGFKINQTANKINNKFNTLLQKYDIAPEQRAALESKTIARANLEVYLENLK